MSTTEVVVLAVAAAVVLLAIVIVAAMSGRRRRLRRRFGSEYERTIDLTGSKREAERELLARKARHDQLPIRALTPESRRRFTERWEAAQARFVDEPPAAMADADRLVQQAMAERGYPLGDFEQQTADLSVEHADVIDNYRKAHDIAQNSERGRATTEDLRRGMVHYRTLFSELSRATDDRHDRSDDRHHTGRIG